MKAIVEMDWVAQRVEQDSLRVIDCRFKLGDSEDGQNRYNESHIPGAVYLDLEKDLSGPIQVHGGRHPLPDLNELTSKLGAIGIDETVTVVAYDDEGGPFASRLWWLLHYLGHENVYVMNGSFSEWAKQYKTAKKIPQFETKVFKANIKPDLLASRTDVYNMVKSRRGALIDSRETPRFEGKVEPIDKIAGHIPTAKNFFWRDVLKEQGTLKKDDELASHFATVNANDSIIVYCGSGVTACPNVLALKQLGYNSVKLYIGSWSDWISYKDAKIERTE
ncbi:sulfurtransferase [Halalkalibacter urbisdiaboli]|uniref:sulfurtransferase n=1 Tax=Halalkalibacter urbisdiaboli TaxID=1960589 RepID=UPI000B43999A|nr:sulfurtransferase [Halalkalibacter urbisdiaboli]